jgi:hypothetical protein
MGLTALERETVVSFNDGEEMALVVTHQPRVITALKKNPAAVLVEEGVFGTSRWARFQLPRSLIGFWSKRRKFGEAERALRAARLRAARAAAAAVDTSRGSGADRRSASEASIPMRAANLSTSIDDSRSAV